MSNKIDALVAEKVMGFTWWSACGKSYLIPPWVEGFYGFRDGKHYHFVAGKQHDAAPIELSYSDYQNLAIPPYSTSIFAAWAVVEKMQDHLPSLTYRCGDGPPFDKMRWVCEFMRDFLPGDWKGAARDTAPLAICIAALKAVGVPESEIQEALKP